MSEQDPVLERRARLAPEDAPSSPHEYVVDVGGKVTGQKVHVKVRYIPEKKILRTSAFKNYLALLHHGEESLEMLSNIIFSDLINEIVPFWIHVSVSEDEEGIMHQVAIEDRQPNWDNPALLSRISLL
jgi:NADPH-dependent 7-cyano-7-deazaguanine reductase QueF